MIKLRCAGIAACMALFLALAVFTTGAFAQSAQANKASSASTHAATVVHTRAALRPFGFRARAVNAGIRTFRARAISTRPLFVNRARFARGVRVARVARARFRVARVARVHVARHVRVVHRRYHRYHHCDDDATFVVVSSAGFWGNCDCWNCWGGGFWGW